MASVKKAWPVCRQAAGLPQALEGSEVRQTRAEIKAAAPRGSPSWPAPGPCRSWRRCGSPAPAHGPAPDARNRCTRHSAKGLTSANKCVLPAAAATGYDITGLTCGAATTSAGAVETTTGTINCATPHTCVAATCVAVAGLAVRCRGSDGRPLLRTGTTRPRKAALQATRSRTRT